jgi:SRSO17 transposase
VKAKFGLLLPMKVRTRMQLNMRRAWSSSFEEFWRDFAKCFKREEARQAAEKYVRGLLAEVERKNCWQLAEIMKESDPQAMQRLLYQAQWDGTDV